MGMKLFANATVSGTFSQKIFQEVHEHERARALGYCISPHITLHHEIQSQKKANNYDRKQQEKEHHQLLCLNKYKVPGAENKQFCPSLLHRERSHHTAIPFTYAAEVTQEENGTYVFLLMTTFYF